MTRRQDTDPEMLVIDRAAAAEIPTIDAIQEWASDACGRDFSAVGVLSLTSLRRNLDVGEHDCCRDQCTTAQRKSL